MLHNAKYQVPGQHVQHTRYTLKAVTVTQSSNTMQKHSLGPFPLRQIPLIRMTESLLCTVPPVTTVLR